MTRVEREIANPDAALVEAMREVDAMLPASPPIAPQPPPPPTLLAGNSVWRAPLPVITADQKLRGMLAGSSGGQALGQAQALGRVVDKPGQPFVDTTGTVWFAPFVSHRMSGTDKAEYLLKREYGNKRVSREWLELHRHDIVDAMRRL